MNDFDYDFETNNEVKDALVWAKWLSSVKDPGPALLAAKANAKILMDAYYAMLATISGYEHGSP